MENQIEQKSIQVQKSAQMASKQPEKQENLRNTKSDAKSWILVLNTEKSGHTEIFWAVKSVPLIVDGRGQSKEIRFEFGPGTEVDQSCSIVWRGKMYVFGGKDYKRQISAVDGCQLKKKGELTFDMTNGACAQRENNEVFICFENSSDLSTYKNCHRSNGPLERFVKLPSSSYDHRSTRIAVTSGEPNAVYSFVHAYVHTVKCYY